MAQEIIGLLFQVFGGVAAFGLIVWGIVKFVVAREYDLKIKERFSTFESKLRAAQERELAELRNQHAVALAELTGNISVRSQRAVAAYLKVREKRVDAAAQAYCILLVARDGLYALLRHGTAGDVAPSKEKVEKAVATLRSEWQKIAIYFDSDVEVHFSDMHQQIVSMVNSYLGYVRNEVGVTRAEQFRAWIQLNGQERETLENKVEEFARILRKILDDTADSL
ncbi:hypothetical protein HNQ50_001388 [Silvimonas terrae]|uniref:Uncharacterized protein n=1 Tax=Silvimonas terrae TaxID=300266 RepID=A0A840RE07_9NEIS|nr:hypothetical protein [Silvimonas terrae]MBB5190666.1 hypothetical protein [Silvimonas terrae]